MRELFLQERRNASARMSKEASETALEARRPSSPSSVPVRYATCNIYFFVSTLIDLILKGIGGVAPTTVAPTARLSALKKQNMLKKFW